MNLNNKNSQKSLLCAGLLFVSKSGSPTRAQRSCQHGGGEEGFFLVLCLLVSSREEVEGNVHTFFVLMWYSPSLSQARM